MLIKLLSGMVFFVLTFGAAIAQEHHTQRIQEFSNDRVNVWKTMIYATSKAKLTMHRHDHDRVLVALTDGVLKVTNNVGQVHYLTFKQGKSSYLPKDPRDELHMDENVTNHLISVIVIELK